MERRDDNDMGAIAMPGFIDILSTVIIMFVFFVTVIAIMLYVHTVKFKAQVMAESQAHVSKEVLEYMEKIESGEISPDDLSKVLDLAKKKNDIKREVEELSKDAEQIRTRYAESSSTQETQEVLESKEFVVFFERNAITTAEEVEGKMTAFLEKIGGREQWKTWNFTISGGTNPAAPTLALARELTLARILNVRNNLLKSSVPQNRIHIEYSKDPMRGNDYNWVKITVTR